MPQAKQYRVKLNNCSFGKKGDVIELAGELTDRQKVMLTEYKAPEVKKVEPKADKK